MERKKRNSGVLRRRLGIALLILSAACWAAYLAGGVYAYFAGCSAGLLSLRRVYGWEAFEEAMFWNLLRYSILPVLPASFLYIAAYLIVKGVKRRKGARGRAHPAAEKRRGAEKE